MDSHRRIVKSLSALLVALMLALRTGALPADAATFDSSYCTTQLHGNWTAVGDQYTCTIPSGHTGSIAAGTTVFLYAHVGSYQKIVVSSGATLNIAGALSLYGGTLENNGTVSVSDTGEIHVLYDPSTAWGVLTNNGTLGNSGTISVWQDATSRGALYSYGTFNNNAGGSVENYSTTFQNYGVLTSNGFITNQSGAVLDDYGQFTNSSAAFFNYGTFWVRYQASPEYTGSFVNSSTGTITIEGGSIRLVYPATVTNDGTIDLDSTSFVDGTGALTNSGHITSDGSFSVGDMTNLAGSVFTNSGTFTVDSDVVNEGTFTNYDTFSNVVGGSFTNSNVLNNYGTIDNDRALFTNSAGAVVENHDSFNNTDFWFTRVHNSGAINNYCPAIFQRPSSMDFSGNNPVELCAPNITSAAQTTFTVGTVGNFAVTTTGSPVPSPSRTGDALPSGVNFTDNGDGTATLAGTPAAGTVGVYHFTFTASNGVSPNATQSFTLTVNKANTTTSVTSSENPSPFGESVTLTAHVTPAHTGGTVEFRLDGSTISGCSAKSLVSGQATCASSSLTVGSHAVTAYYSGDASYNPSDNSASPLTQTVEKADTTTAVASSQNPSTFGQSVTLTSHVTPASTGGTMTFKDGTTDLCVAVAVSGGQATCASSALTIGAHTITAYYSGDANYNSSDNSGSPLTQTVNKMDTTTTLYTSGTPSILGDSVTFTAQVSPTPTGGTVTFQDGSTDLCTGVTVTGGQATCATSALTVGSHTIAAYYSGNASYNASSASGTQMVNYPVPTIASIDPTSKPVNAPDFTLTVTGTNFVAASVVRWNGIDRTTTYVSSTKLTASISKNDLSAAGTANVTVYTPTPGGGSSNAATFTITPANSAVTLVSSLNPSTFSQAVTFTATVTQTVGGVGVSSRLPVRRLDAVPGGTMTFYDDGVVIGTAPLNASGLATYTTSSLAAGTHPITAVYPGDANFGAGTSNQVDQLVNNPVPTLTSINPTSKPVNAPDFTLTVTGTNFVAGSVVQWNGSNRTTTFVSSTKLTATISKNDLSAAGTATVTVFSPAPGGGTSNSATFTISPTASTVTVVLASSCNPCMLDQTVRITATVTNTLGASSSRAPVRRFDAVPGGTMTFNDNGNNIGGCVNVGLNGTGQAVCATILAGGQHTITGQYSGDANFNPASGTLTQDVSYLLLLPDIRKNGH